MEASISEYPFHRQKSHREYQQVRIYKYLARLDLKNQRIKALFYRLLMRHIDQNLQVVVKRQNHTTSYYPVLWLKALLYLTRTVIS